VRDLTVSLVQRELSWEDPAANRADFEAALATLDAAPDVVVLPEMFTTGFSMRSESLAEDEASDTLPWLQQQAARHDCAITGSLPVRSGRGIYNRLLFVTPTGEVFQYDKRHLFRLSGEHRHYAAGRDRLVVDFRGWRLCPMICYDLRFPVFSRNRDDYDALLFIANWPAKRRYHWRQLLIARAIENQSYTIGLNRIGRDGNGLDYSGDSLVVASDGQLLLDCEDRSGVFTVSLDASAMAEYRRKFPCHEDADEFELKD
jgi:predicted amidohydrolase